MKAMLLAAVAALTLGAVAHAAPPAEPERQASIPFVNHQGIRDWRAVDDRTLYLQDSRRRWYRATLFGPCLDLPFAQTIGFETRGIDTFDRFASIEFAASAARSGASSQATRLPRRQGARVPRSPSRRSNRAATG